MIRLFTALGKSILDKLTDEHAFREVTDIFRHYDQRCPHCGAYGRLYPYGSYSRNLVSFEDSQTIEHRINTLRFKCLSCIKTHALLPDVLIPYSPYSMRFKLSVLAAYFQRDTTVAALCERFGIAISTLYAWKKRLLSHKELMTGALASRKEQALSFIHNLLDSAGSSDCLRSFFSKHAFSFMQGISKATTRLYPP